MLVRMTLPEHPVATGVIRSVFNETYNDALEAQMKTAKEHSEIQSLDDLIKTNSFTV